MAGYDGAGACYWKNGQRVALPGDGYANDIAVSGRDVYAAGYWVNVSGGLNTVARYWKNGREVPLSDGKSKVYAEAIAINGNDVYVAGYEADAAFNRHSVTGRTASRQRSPNRAPRGTA